MESWTLDLWPTWTPTPGRCPLRTTGDRGPQPAPVRPDPPRLVCGRPARARPGVRRHRHRLRRPYGAVSTWRRRRPPCCGADRPRPAYAVTPVHAWQLRHVVREPLRRPGRRRHPGAARRDRCRPADRGAADPAAAGAATAALPQGVTGHPGHLDPRTISVASTRNGPALSRCWRPARQRPGAADGGDGRLGDGGPGGRERDLAAILRGGLSGGWPRRGGGARRGLYALVPGDRRHRRRRVGRPLRPHPRHPDGAGGRAGASSRSTPGCCCRRCCGWPPGTASAWRRTCRTACPRSWTVCRTGSALRDLAGLRVYPPRLRAAACGCGRARSSSTDDVDVMRAKVGLHRPAGPPGRDRGAAGRRRTAWTSRRPGGGTRGGGRGLRRAAGRSGLADRAAADHAFLTAPTVPHKALLRMRLAAARGGGGDIYVRVENPLR